MKKFLLATTVAVVLAGSAQAADMPVKAPPAVGVVAAWNWSGCYIGGHAGGGWARKEWSTESGPFAEHTASGVLGGGQLGCDYQTGAWVFGFEGQASWANLSGDSIEFRFDGAENYRARSEIDFLATLTGRVGYAWGRSLVYVKGGVAWVREDFTETFIPDPTRFTTARDSRTGWVLGAGWEHALAANWTVKLEYNYMDFGKKQLTFSGTEPFAPFFNDVDQIVHTAKIGVNYRFGGPLVARY